MRQRRVPFWSRPCSRGASRRVMLASSRCELRENPGASILHITSKGWPAFQTPRNRHSRTIVNSELDHEAHKASLCATARSNGKRRTPHNPVVQIGLVRPHEIKLQVQSQESIKPSRYRKAQTYVYRVNTLKRHLRRNIGQGD